MELLRNIGMTLWTKMIKPEDLAHENTICDIQKNARGPSVFQALFGAVCSRLCWRDFFALLCSFAHLGWSPSLQCFNDVVPLCDGK